MAYLASTFTFESGGRAGFSGQLHWITPDFADTVRMHLPPSVSAYERHPSVINYLGRAYLVGGHTRNILIDEDLRCLRQGIQPPPPPTFSLAGGAIPMIGYLRFYDEMTGERSSISDGAATVGALPRTWAALPTTVPAEEITIEGTVTVVAGVVAGVKTNFGVLRPGDRVADATVLTRWAQVRSITSDVAMTTDDTGFAIGAGGTLVVKPVSRVSHVEGWAAVSGGLPRLAMRARLGTASVVESVATLALGEALTDSYEPMPTGGFSVVFNDRQVIAGVEGSRDTVYLSDIGFPERHGGLRFKTDYGESVVGMFVQPSFVVVLCSGREGESSYRLYGYTDDDFKMVPLEANAGGLGHHGNRETRAGIVMVPSVHGMQMFNGAFHPAMPTRESEWTRDCRENIAAFEGGFGAVNPNDKTYRFMPYVNRIDVSSDEPPEAVETPGIYFISGGTGGALAKITAGTGVMVQYALSYGNLGCPVVRVGADGKIYTTKNAGGQFIRLTLDDNTLIATAEILFDAGSTQYFSDIFQANNRDFFIYLHLTDGPVGGKIYRYTGTGPAVLEATYPSGTTTQDAQGAFGEIGDGIYIALGNTVNFADSVEDRIARRNPDGTWTALSIPGAVPRLRIHGRPAIFNNKLWWIGTSIDDGGAFHAVLLSVNGGATVTVERSIPLGVFTGMEGYVLAAFDNKLYYLYKARFGGAAELRMGYVDLAGTFTDNIHSFFNDGTQDSIGMLSISGYLYVVRWNAGDGEWQIERSTGVDTSVFTNSTWPTGHTPASAYADRFLVRY